MMVMYANRITDDYIYLRRLFVTRRKQHGTNVAINGLFKTKKYEKWYFIQLKYMVYTIY